MLLAEVDRFFIFYEREFKPLGEDIKRYWRLNIAAGNLLISELKAFYLHSAEEYYELHADIRRFYTYSTLEWRNLLNRVKRFATCAHDPAFGDGIVPFAGDQSPGVMNDFSVPRSESFIR